MIVSLEQLKAHLRIQHDDENALLESLLLQASAVASDFCMAEWGADAPHPVRLAVTLMASHYYEYRESADRFAYRAMRMSFESLLWPYRDVTKLI